jgi:hypothetical protein
MLQQRGDREKGSELRQCQILAIEISTMGRKPDTTYNKF